MSARTGAFALAVAVALLLSACGGATPTSHAAAAQATPAPPTATRASTPAPTAPPAATAVATPAPVTTTKPTASPTPAVVQGLFEGDFTVKVGTTVRFTNTDDAEPHTVTARDGSWDTGVLMPGQSVKITFNRPGKYPYYCEIHPNMIGTLTVVK